ncbi:MAG: PhoH family protein [Nitrospirae bacterium]|nr:PhoH family protein [Nitrospirota bacterium]NTW65227.1 PhoH family protein [Nitrospirota bacterium]
MKKVFVLDTNVLLHDPRAIFSFEDNDVVVPIVVIEELDKFKKGIDEIGRNARQVSRILDEYRQKGKLSQGVKLEGGGCLRVELNHQSPERLPNELIATKADNRILATALNLKHDDLPVILVTKDTNLRIKADALGMRAEDYESDTITLDELYSGEVEMAVDPGAIEEFYSGGELPAVKPKPLPNQFVLIKNNANPSQTALARYSQQKHALVPIANTKHGIWGISARNKQQQYALDLLLNDDIRLVTLVGRAGTGKTLLALAAGLEKTIENRAFQRLVVSRPVFPLGKDIGFLPGDIEEKLRPWMQPIRDNLDFLMGASASAVAGRAKGKKDLQSLFDLGMIEVEPLTYIRGRSMPNQYLIVDEAQNLTPHEIKTIITRAGEGTKVVLTGDPYQIDNPYIDSSSNGLTYVVDRFKEETIAGHITLVKGERSDLAELAATLL